MRKIIKLKTKLRTWVSLSLIAILLPIAVFRVVFSVIGAPPVASAIWHLDEAAGTTAGDASNNSNSGTVTNASWRTKELCLSENCLFFDGAGDYVTRADDADFDFLAADKFTFSVWFRHAPKTSGTEVLVAKHNATAGGYKIIMESDGDITCGIDDDSTYGPEDFVTSTAATYDDNKWHYVSCVKDGTTSLTLYIDGNSVGTPDTSFVATGTLANADAFYVGIDGNGSSNPFTGFLDEFKMYRVALTRAEIVTDYNQGIARFAPQPKNSLSDGLVGYWPMDETSWSVDCSTSTVLDRSGNANNGRACPNSTGPTGGAASKYGLAGSFDGSNDYVEVPSSSNLHPGDTFTLAAWVKRSSSGTFDSVFGTSTNDFQLAFVNDNIKVSKQSISDVFVSTSTYTDTTSWHHIVATKNGSQSTKVFYDGVEIAGTYTDQTIVAGSSSIYIGGDSFASDVFAGGIDEARIYNRALSPAEVRELYNWVPGPVAYWNMDENTGQNVYDISGNGLNGVLGDNNTSEADDALWNLGKYGSGTRYTADPADRHIRVEDNNLLDIPATENFTISAWVKRTGGAEFDNAMSVLFKANGDAAVGYFLTLAAPDCGTASNGGNFICFSVNDGTDSYHVLTTSTITADSTWHHVEAVFDRSSATNTNIFVDGVIQSVTRTGTLANVGAIDDTGPLCIGVQQGNSCSNQQNQFNGSLDEIKIYTYARSQQQVIEDMNAGHPIGGSPLGTSVIKWNFDSGNGTTAYNDVDLNTDGTLTSIASPATSSSGWTRSGKINGGIVFDGTDDKVAIANASDSYVDFIGSEKFSTCAWVYPTTMPGSGEFDAIVAKWDATTPTRGYRMTLTNDDADTTGNFRAEIYDESTDQTISAFGSNDTVSTNTWYHVCMTFNGGVLGAASDLKLYINGYLKSSSSANASFLGLEDVTADFTVGDYDVTDVVAADTAFTGTIDEVQVYSDELSEESVRTVLNANSSSALSTLSGPTTEESDVSGSVGNPPFAYWNFDDNTSTNVQDISGNGYAGTWNGTTGTVWGPGKIGAAGKFNGTDNYVATTNTNSVKNLSQVTLELWFKPTTLGTAQNLYFEPRNSDGTTRFELRTDTSSTLLFGGRTPDSGGYINFVDDTRTLTVNTWYHVAAVFDSTNDVHYLYLNGVPAKGTDATSTFDNTNPSSTPRIGSGPGSAFFNGVIDDVKLYNYARTPSQIAYDFNRGAPIGWWKMDDCTGTNVHDLSLGASLGGANDGTWSGASGSNTSAGTCSAVDSATAWYNGRNGKFGSSLHFDGTDDTVSIGDPSNGVFDFGTGDFSLSAWVKYTNSNDSGIVTKLDGSNLGYSLGESTNKIRFFIDAGNNYIDSNSSINDGSWHHIVANRSGSTLNVYVDGKEDESNCNACTSASASVSTSGSLYFGNKRHLTGNFFNGLIDDVRIYNYALTLTQIRKIMNEGSAIRFGPTTGTP